MRFYLTDDLVNLPEREKLDVKAGLIVLSLAPMDLVILNEPRYLPFSQTGGCLAVLSAVQVVQAYQRHHHKPEFLGMVERVWPRQNDYGLAGSIDASLPCHGNG